jgi:ElaB/YqjD/DUF883 family membrane-anchored ribosome-binding protein
MSETDQQTTRTKPRRGRAAEAIDDIRERTYSAYETARRRTADVTRQATDQMTVYPVGAVLGGLAVGALVGLLVPRTRRESELLAPAGRKLAEAAREAAQKGVDAGREQADQITGNIVNRLGSAVVEAGGGKDDG